MIIKIEAEKLSEIIDKTLARFGQNQCNLSEGARAAIIKDVLNEIEKRKEPAQSDPTLLDAMRGGHNDRS